jgi:hypothetical protein
LQACSLVIDLLDLLSGEVEVLLLGQFRWGLLLHLLAELWHDVVLVKGVVRELNVVLDNHVTVQFIIDAQVNIVVSVLWHEACGLHNLLLNHWFLVSLGLSLLSCLLSFPLGLGLLVSLGLLLHDSLISGGVVLQLNGHSVVELTLVDGIVVGLRDWHLVRMISPGQSGLLISQLFLVLSIELSLLVVEVLGVDVVPAGLNGHAVVELSLIDGIVVSGWGLNLSSGKSPGLSGLLIFVLSIENLLSSLLLLVIVFRVEVLITGLKGHAVIKLSLINGIVVNGWGLNLSSWKSPGLSGLLIGLLVVEDLLSFFLLLVVVLRVEVIISSLNGHAVIKLSSIDGLGARNWDLGWNSSPGLSGLLIFVLSIENLLSSLLLVVVVLRVDVVITSLEGHAVIELVLVERGVLLAVDSSLLFLISHNGLKLSLGSRDSTLPVLGVVLDLKSHAIVELTHIDSLEVVLLFLLLIGAAELLSGKLVGGTVNLVLLVLGSILVSDGLLKLSSLLLNHVVPELGVTLITKLGVGLESDLICGNTAVDVVEVNSLNSLLLSLLLGELLGLLSLLSLGLGLLLDRLSLGLLGGLLVSDLLSLLSLHVVLELLSLLVDKLVPLLGMVVVIGLLAIFNNILGVLSVWDMHVSELHVGEILSSLLVHDALDLIGNLLGLILSLLTILLLDKLRLVKEWFSLLVLNKLVGELNVLLVIELNSSLLEEVSPLGILSHSFSGRSSHDWSWSFSIDVLSIILMVELNIRNISEVLNGLELSFVEEVIIVLAVIELHVLPWVVVVALLAGSHALLLGVVALEVLVEESGVVAIWGQFRVVESLVVVSDSWEVLWGVRDLWVVGGEEVLVLSAVESLGWIIKIEPIGSGPGLAVKRGLEISSKLTQILGSSNMLLLNVVSVNFGRRNVLN